MHGREGMCGRGCVWQEEMPTAADGMHLTGMLSCYIAISNCTC